MSGDHLEAKALVRQFLDMLWNKKDPGAAAELLADDYVEHNPRVPQGVAGFVATADMMLREHPEMSVSFERVISEGDIAVAHVHLKLSAQDRGFAAVDICRLENGRIVERWDVVQPVPSEAANPNGMF